MSKSRGNVVNPDDYYTQYGADTLRMYLMFLGPYEQGGDWNDQGIVGIYRFLGRVWNFTYQVQSQKLKGKSKSVELEVSELEVVRNKTIKKITGDIENLRYNTAIAALMEFTNEIGKNLSTVNCQLSIVSLLKLLAPFAPHITEELWHGLGHGSAGSPQGKTSIHNEKWPLWNEKYLKEDKVKIIVQVNGRVRDQFEVQKGSTEAEVRQVAEKRERIVQWMEGKAIKKVFFVQDRLINFVI